MKHFILNTILSAALISATAPARAASPASDSACDGAYSGGGNWNGANGGSGFNAWQLIPASNGGNSGTFIGNSGQNGGGGGTGINCAPSTAWGMYANSGAQSTGLRVFQGGALIPGQSVAIDMDNGWIDGPYENNNVVELQLLNSSGQMRFGFHYRGGAGDYQIYDASDDWFQRGTGIQFTDGGLHIVFTLNSIDTYTVQITRLDDNSTSTFSGTLGGPAGSPVDRFYMVNRSAGNGANFDAFFNNLSVSCNGQPSAPTAGSDSPLCAGQDLHLVSSAVAGGSYSWTGPNGFTSSLQNPTIANASAAASGTYVVNVTLNGCTSADSSTSVTIHDAPAAPAPSNDGAVCPGGTLHLFANTTAGSYTWTGPNGFTSSDQNPSVANVTAADAGTYNLVVSDSGCSSPMGSTTVAVKTPPSCSISGPGEVCAGSSVVYAGPEGDGLTYAWSVTGDAIIDGDANHRSVNVSAGSTGFSVNLTVTEDGCSSTCNLSIGTDQTSPVITCPADVTIECSASTDPSNTGSATATDNCTSPGAIAISHSDVTSGSGCSASIARTWTAEDAAGNSATCVQTISLQDTTAPALSGVPANVNLQCSSDLPGEPSAPRAWGMYANSGAISEAIRPLASALTVGQKFVIDLDNGFLDTGAATGFGLQNALGQNRFELIFVGGDAFYRVKGDGADIISAIGYTGEGLHVEVTLTGADTYSVKIIRIQSGDTQTVTGNLGGEAGSAIDHVRLFNYTAGGGAAFDTFFNSMGIPGVAFDSASDPAYDDGWLSGDNGGSGFGAWSVFGSGGNEPDNFGRFIGNATQNDGGDSNSDGDINSLNVTATDNCDAHVGVSYSQADNGASGCAGHPRIITRTWTATDDCGNTTAQSQTITQEDTEAPVLSDVPADVTVQCIGDVPAIPVVTALDNCDASATVQYSETSDAGQIVRTWTSADACGNVASASQTVTIHDSIAPVLNGQGADATIEAPAVPSFAAPTASDNCDADPDISFTDATTAGGCAGAYSVTRTWIATDAGGNDSAPASQTITVIDTTAPVLSGEGAEATIEAPAVPSFTAPTASDNSDANPALTYTDSTNAGACAAAYSVTRTWVAVDACGNGSGPVSQTIHVVDTTAPVLSGLPADISVECDSVPLAATVTAMDNADGSIWVAFEESVTPGDCANSYTMTRIWSAVDGCGNSVSATQVITVADTTAPVVTATLAAPNVLINTSFEEGPAHAATNIPGWTRFNNSFQEAFAPRTGTNHLKAFGNFGTNENFSGWYQDVAAQAGQVWRGSVYVMQPSDDTWVAGNEAKLRLEFYDASDVLVGAADSVHLKSTMPQDLYTLLSVTATAPAGTAKLRIVPTYMQLDPTNGTGSAYFDDARLETLHTSIHVETLADVPAPDISLVVAQDHCDLAPAVILIGDVASEGSGCANYPIIVTRTFRGTDACGNSSDVSVTINVSDTTAPVLAGVPADATVQCDAVPAAAAVTATDNSGGEVAVSMTQSQAPGTCGYLITRTWTAADACGNSSSASQTITVEDSTAPTLSGQGANETVECPASPSFTAPTASDNCDASPSLSFTDATTPGACSGSYTVTRTWTAADQCGNVSAPVSQSITVVDTTAPVLSGVPANVTVQSSGAIPAPASPTASDSCDAAPVVSLSETDVPGACPGSHTITRTWTATDACGNHSSASQTITVQDTTAPVLSVPADVAIECSGDTSPAATGNATATDDSGSATVSYSDVSFDGCGNAETITRTWTATDACGNQSSAVQTVAIVDTVPPVITCPANQTVAPIAQPAKFHASVDVQFNAKPIPAGRTIWFNSMLRINHEGQAPTTVWLENSKIVFTANSTTYTVAVPNGVMYVTPVTNGTTLFNAASNRWETTVPKQADDHAFLVGVAFTAPVNLPGNIVATWSGDFTGDRLGVTANWKLGAAVYTNFSSNYNLLGVKPVNGTRWSSQYPNRHKAGTPENYKSAVTEGATSRNNLHNNCGNDDEDYIGRRVREKHVIPKKRDAQMSICDGIVVFNEPTATDACGGTADVECDPPSGSDLGPGAHTIHATAVDACGNTSTCSFVVTVLSPIRVEFKSPLEDDNLANNGSSSLVKSDPDWCADAPGTSQVINKFKAGANLNHKVKLFDCNGNDITDTANVTVKIDVTERVGSYTNSAMVVDVPEVYTGNGDPGGVLELTGHHYQYNLKTTGYEEGTVDNSKFFRSVISVEYNWAPGVKVGIEDVILESK